MFLHPDVVDAAAGLAAAVGSCCFLLFVVPVASLLVALMLSFSCCLGLLPPPDMEYEAAEALMSLTANASFHCLIEGVDNEKRRRCVLTAEEDHAEKRETSTFKCLPPYLIL